MKDLSIHQKTEIAVKKHKEAMMYIQVGNAASYHLASILYEIKEKKLYRYAIGEGANTWSSYCQTLGINVSTADKLIDRYRTYVLTLKIPVQQLCDIPTLNLQMILPLVKKQPERVNELLAKAKNLRSIDLTRELITEKIGDVCLHPKMEVKVYCPVCREFFPEKSEQLKKLMKKLDTEEKESIIEI